MVVAVLGCRLQRFGRLPASDNGLPRLFDHPEFDRRDAGLEHAVGRHRNAIHGKAAKGALERVEGHAGVDQGAKHHVAGGAGKAIEIERRHVWSVSALKLKKRPAPRITWSSSVIPSTRPASLSRAVSTRSA